MAKKITPVQRATAWRKEKMAEGYKLKTFLLSPAALAGLDALKKVYRTERDAAEVLFARAGTHVRKRR